MDWREHCWKNIIRYFKTPYQEKHKGDDRPCWRQCGAKKANHFHIFWDCPKLKTFWNNIHKTLCSVFDARIPLDFITLYLGHIECLNQTRDTKLIQVLLAASKKSITRRWLTPIPPTMDDWHGIVLDIFRMEKLTYILRTRVDYFYRIWNNWIVYIAPMRADFV